MAQTPPDNASPNRLARESSPYLLLHQHNPVDWYPWGEEAIEKARREDKPIFLSVGYSTCYWCHVMERESFSDPGVARLMNDRFVNVKVDREERPDVDEIYMTATQILTSHGGWPNSVFLTPQLEPFYAGTYFPPEERHGRPSFAMVLAGLADAWENRQKEVLLQAEEMGRAMRRVLEERFPAGDAPAPPGAAVAAARALGRTFDAEHGGFGKAPKFPTPANLYLLTELAWDPAHEGETQHPDAGEMLSATLDAMARGGLYDQLGGGFHRYSTDARWQVPHFEKMLYDNGCLLELYAKEYARTGDAQAARIVRETADWLAREMTSPEGAFWSAIDAETDGREGAFYAWSREQLREVLGEEDFQFLAPLYGFDGEPFFEGEYVLHLPARLDEQAQARRTTREALLAEIEPLRERLFEARAQRDRPATDDKILTDWNGMAIRGMAIAGRLLDDPDLVERAERAGRAVVELTRAGDVLLHAVRKGEGRIAAYLSDYAFLAWGFLALADATGDEHWVTESIDLVDEMNRRLAHPDGGWYNAAEAPDLLVRSQEIFDGATPAANAVAILVLLDLGRRTHDPRYRELARKALAAFSPVVEQSPEAVRMLSLANRRLHLPAWGAPWPPPGLEDQAPRPARATAQQDEAHSAVVPTLELGEPDGDGDDDGSRTFTLVLEIAPGWHVNAHDIEDDALVPTAVEAEGAEILDVTYPPGRTLAAGDGEISVYQGTVAVRGRLRGGGRLVLSYQPCDDERCLPVVRRVLKLGP